MQITDEAVEAAARAIFNSARGGNDPRTWEEARGDLSEWISMHARAALEAALPHLLDRWKVGAMLDDIDGGLELLRLAIAAQDPKAELLYRVKDLVADVEHLRTLAHPQKGGEGC